MMLQYFEQTTFSLGNIVNIIAKANRVIIALLLFFLLSIMFLNVILRYVFNSPFSWADEVSKYIMIWLGFLGASIALLERKHIGIDMIVRHLPARLIPLISILSHIGTTLFLIFMLWYGVIHTQIAGPRQTIMFLNIPMTFVFIVTPISASLMLLYQIAILSDEIKKFLSSS